MRIKHAVPIDDDHLVQADRVQSALYTDPVIFDEEMENIFTTAECSSATTAKSAGPAATSPARSATSR